LVRLLDTRNQLEVVDVNHPGAEFTVLGPEVESANGAAGTEVGDAGRSGFFVSFVSVYSNSALCAFRISPATTEIVWEGSRRRRFPESSESCDNATAFDLV
jgi:hypothetical protein